MDKYNPLVIWLIKWQHDQIAGNPLEHSLPPLFGNIQGELV
jgi:hypothetical protein